MINKERRRISSSGRAQQLWDAIKAVRLQKQIPAITRMGRYMSRYYQLKRDDTQRLLDLAVEDNLIKLETKIGTKGTKSGVEEKAYRLPTSDMLSRERHDWYCFKCHAGGEVILCSTCHRVYHEDCISSEEIPAGSEEDYICKYCQALQKIHEGSGDNKRERRDLNHLFRHIILRSKKKLPERIYAREVPQPPSKNLNDPLNNNNMMGAAQLLSPQCSGAIVPPQPMPSLPTGLNGVNVGSGLLHPPAPVSLPSTPNIINNSNNNNINSSSSSSSNMNASNTTPEGKKLEEELWRASFLLKEQIDFAEIERKCLAIEYRDITEFKADAHLLIHNIIIFHGVLSSISDAARSAFRDILRDLRELELCRDCFRHSVEPEGDRHWFTKPCRPPHELVYAKQKGFPFWPAKVMKVQEGNYDVRFFGGYHQRALVEKASIRPISVNIHSLQVKRTSALNKACEELRRHQEVLEKVKDSVDLSGDPVGNPFFEIKVEFPEESEGDSESDILMADATGSKDPSSFSSSLYPGEPTRLKEEEESELMRKPPIFVPGEAAPTPGRPNSTGGPIGGNITSNNTSILNPGATSQQQQISTNVAQTIYQHQQQQQTLQQSHHHQQQLQVSYPPHSSGATSGGVPAVSVASSTINASALFDGSQLLGSSGVVSAGTTLPLVNGSPLSIQTPGATGQQFHILHHQFQNHHAGQQHQMRLVPVSGGSGGTIHIPAGSLDPQTHATLLEAGAIIATTNGAGVPGGAAGPGGAGLAHHPTTALITTATHHHPGGLTLQAAPPAAPGGNPGPELVKKKRGRPKKSKKEEAEDFVSSSSSNQESRFINAGVQTPTKLLKTSSSNPAANPQAQTTAYLGHVTSSNVLGAAAAQQQQQQQLHHTLGASAASSAVVAAAPESGSLQLAVAGAQSQGGGLPPPSVAAVAASQGLMTSSSAARKPAERELKEFADKLRQEFEQEKKRAVNVATRSLERDLERLKADHNTEIEEILEKHKMELSENKKKQWCYHCEAGAIYWCCWNTAYCSIECQQEHWHKEHKRMCRRKR